MGLLLCFRLLDLGEPSERFFFCLGVELTGDCFPELTGPSSETSDGSTSLGDVLVKFANLISKLNFYKLIPYPMDNS